MDFAEMTRMYKLADWVQEFLQSSKEVDSIHFDELVEMSSNKASGFDLVSNAAVLLKSVTSQLNALFEDRGVRYVLVYLPLDVTDDILSWSSQLLLKAGHTFEPPSLYMLRRNYIFGDTSEEYRKPVEIPNISDENIRVLFHSSRSSEGILHSWEFYSGIYLISEVGPGRGDRKN
jgi:hypothetical protein